MRILQFVATPLYSILIKRLEDGTLQQKPIRMFSNLRDCTLVYSALKLYGPTQWNPRRIDYMVRRPRRLRLQKRSPLRFDTTHQLPKVSSLEEFLLFDDGARCTFTSSLGTIVVHETIDEFEQENGITCFDSFTSTDERSQQT